MLTRIGWASAKRATIQLSTRKRAISRAPGGETDTGTGLPRVVRGARRRRGRGPVDREGEPLGRADHVDLVDAHDPPLRLHPGHVWHVDLQRIGRRAIRGVDRPRRLGRPERARDVAPIRPLEIRVRLDLERRPREQGQQPDRDSGAEHPRAWSRTRAGHERRDRDDGGNLVARQEVVVPEQPEHERCQHHEAGDRRATLTPARVLRSAPTAISRAIRATKRAAPAARPAGTDTRRLSRLTDHSTTIVDSRLVLGTWAIQLVPCEVSVSASGSIAAWTTATIATQAITARLATPTAATAPRGRRGTPRRSASSPQATSTPSTTRGFVRSDSREPG